MTSHVPSAEDPHWLTHRRYLYLLAKLVLFLGLFWLSWRLVDSVAAVLTPVFISLVIAYLIDPLIDRLEYWGVNRTVAILAVAVFLLLALSGFALVVVPAFVQQLHSTIERFPVWFEGVYDRGAYLAQEQLGFSSEEIDAAIKKVLASAQATAVTVVSALRSRVSALLNALLVPLFVFYFLRDWDTLKLKPLVLVPPRYRDYVIGRARVMDEVVGHWIRGQVQVALILALLYAAGLTLAGVKLGAVIGLMTGLLNVVPYFGAAVGIILSCLMVLIEHGDWHSLLPVAGVFLVVQLLEGYVITPRLVGEKVGMAPVTVIIVLLVGGSLFGLLGLLFAVPVTAAATVLLQDLIRAYQGTPFYAAGSPTPPVVHTPPPEPVLPETP